MFRVTAILPIFEINSAITAHLLLDAQWAASCFLTDASFPS